MHFTRLRLSGFKSFVDPTELIIAPGLTGIVGPNGCGKSNIVEALKWVMGEVSPKQVRGSEMDDVIFNGTTDRPARNIAEVVVSLDNSGHKTSAHFSSEDQLDVSRRIEREKGSQYRINGRDVRARDAQTMFADLATGARSTALVSQGRIGAIIAAKPAGRRILLEEAAGITGLHARRHEAELRLRGAEGNLERLDDVLQALNTQLQGLKKQARQAKRYRTVADRIRRAEAAVLYLRWTAANTQLENARNGQSVAERGVIDLVSSLAAATTARECAADVLPQLRQDESEAAAVFQRLTLARSELDAEEGRLAEAQNQYVARLTHLIADIERERGLGQDAQNANSNLADERSRIGVVQAEEAATLSRAEATLQAADAAVTDLELEYRNTTRHVATEEARRAALDREFTETEGRITRLRHELTAAETQRRELDTKTDDDPGLTVAEEEFTSSQKILDEARERLDIVEVTYADAQQSETSAREKRQQASEALGKLQTEEAALLEIVRGDPEENWPPIVDAVEVETGYEVALRAAIGDDLQASHDPAAPRHWRELSPVGDAPSLPIGLVPLLAFVGGPTALKRRLNQVGVARSEKEAAQLASHLHMGQRIVTRKGGLWRWDGYTSAPGAFDTAQQELKHRTRLTSLRAELKHAKEILRDEEVKFENTESAAKQSAEIVSDTRTTLRHAEATLNEVRQRNDALLKQAATLRSLRESTKEKVARLTADIEETKTRQQQVVSEQTMVDNLDERRALAEQLQKRLVEARETQSNARATHDRAAREAELCQERLASIEVDSKTWQARIDGAKRRVAELEQRQIVAKEEESILAARPGQITDQRQKLLSQLHIAEANRREAADKLAAAETTLLKREKALKEVSAHHMEAREIKVRSDAQVAQEEQALGTLRERISERLECLPAETFNVAELTEGAELPEIVATEARLERLLRERDNIGPVNLRAENEASELDQQINTMFDEREDLMAAISRLRQGISSLNREARQRLMASFSDVNKHFQDLFTRLFGGGKARLDLVEADDPLAAGLEILASPPGKKLQSMSLLSGGEQALTATALLFAVFLTNQVAIGAECCIGLSNIYYVFNYIADTIHRVPMILAFNKWIGGI